MGLYTDRAHIGGSKLADVKAGRFYFVSHGAIDFMVLPVIPQGLA